MLSMGVGLIFVSLGVVVFFVFFFQAEDGIRDGRVTGVQTCALPISLMRRGSTSPTTRMITWRAWCNELSVRAAPPDAARQITTAPAGARWWSDAHRPRGARH